MLAKSLVLGLNFIPIDHGQKSFFRFFTPVCEADGGQGALRTIKGEQKRCSKQASNRSQILPFGKYVSPKLRGAPRSGVVSLVPFFARAKKVQKECNKVVP